MSHPPFFVNPLQVTLALLLTCLIADGAVPPRRSTHYQGGQGSSVIFDHQPQFDASVPMTIEAWVYREDASRCETIVSHDFTASYWLGFCTRLRFYRSGGSWADADASVPAHQWTHVAASYDGSRVRFYINGVLAGDQALANSGANLTRQLSLGYDPNGTHYRLQGYLDEVRIWSRALTQAEIQQGMLREIRSGSGLVAVFPRGGPHEALSGADGQMGTATSLEIFGILPRELVIPQAAAPVTLDGNIDTAFEYASAEQLVIRYGNGSDVPDALAYLVYRDTGTDENLYVGIKGLRDAAGGWSRQDSWATFQVDANNSRDKVAQPDDFRIQGFLSTDPPKWWWGDGQGGYTQPKTPPSSSLWQVVYGYCDGEFAPPCMEFRISRSLLGGDWSQTNNFLSGHFWVGGTGDDYPAPSDGVWNAPVTWVPAVYGDSTVTLPTVTLSGAVQDLTTGGPAPDRTILLIDDSSSLEIARRTTLPDGTFRFDNVSVAPNVPLRLAMDSCPDCRYSSPVIGTLGMAPTSVNDLDVVFPGCASGSCNYATVTFQLRTPPGPLGLTGFSPASGNAPYILRADPLKQIAPTQVRLFGTNLHDEVEVYLYRCLDLPPLSDCVEGQDYFAAPIVDRSPLGTAADARWIDVTVPDVPVNLRAGGWRWVVHDLWTRADYTEWMAFPGQFILTQPPYPLIHGFEFKNQFSHAGTGDFDGVYGDNAYICGGVPLPDGSCAGCLIRDPVYLLWFAIYKIWLDNAEGSCNGMASTSLLFAQGDLRPSDFEAGVNFADGLSGRPPCDPDDPRLCAPMPDTYEIPTCGPETPANLWAVIRSNHGVQTSDEYIQQCLDQMEGAGLFPSGPATTSSISGNPINVLAHVRSHAQAYVISMVPELGKGHVVTPYRVVDGVDTDGDGVVETNVSRIFVYDNNFPEDTNRFIDIDRTANRYRFDLGGEVWSGDGIYALPLTLWREGHHAPGLTTALQVIGLLVFGDADGLFSSPSGGQWGWKADGTSVDTLKGAKAIVAPAGPGVTNHNVMLFVPLTNVPPSVQMNVHGSNYFFQAGYGGNILQLEVRDGKDGDRDHASLSYASGRLQSFVFAPQSLRTNFFPRVGMVLGDRQRAVFEWDGLSVGSGASLEFMADPDAKGVRFKNSTAGPVHELLKINLLDGPSATAMTNVFGPFEVAAGTVQYARVPNWPPSDKIEVQTDVNGDGTPDMAALVGPSATGAGTPAIRASVTNQTVVISWPVGGTGFILETTDDLESGQWNPVSTFPTLAGDESRVEVPEVDNQRFYRLEEF